MADGSGGQQVEGTFAGGLLISVGSAFVFCCKDECPLSPSQPTYPLLHFQFLSFSVDWDRMNNRSSVYKLSMAST